MSDKCLICKHELIEVGVGQVRKKICPVHGRRGTNARRLRFEGEDKDIWRGDGEVEEEEGEEK